MKMKARHIGIALFVVVFLGFMAMFAAGLKNDPNHMDLATKNTELPAFNLPNLMGSGTVTNKDWTSQQPYYLVNFWGSWCPSCADELPFLVKLSKDHVIYGVNWKDSLPQARAMLADVGNPYRMVVVDEHSDLAIGMGVYGAPETFLIRADGTILYRYAGVLNQKVWDTEFMPRIQKLQAAAHKE